VDFSRNAGAVVADPDFDRIADIARRHSQDWPEASIAILVRPLEDGLQLLSEIKQRFPALPVMMVTAYGDEERRRRAAEFGAADFLTKPVDFDQLKARLSQLPTTAAPEAPL
jgi:DNA-binding response OmpR family regulator